MLTYNKTNNATNQHSRYYDTVKKYLHNVLVLYTIPQMAIATIILIGVT